MRRNPRCSKDGLSKGAWAASEDKILRDYIKIHGEGKWSNVAKNTGLKRCGKSCRLRWMNYLRPDIKRGNISSDEEEMIVRLHKLLGNRWSLIAGRLPGRTDNEIKNYWNTNLAKRAPDLSNRKIQPTTRRVQNRSDLDPEHGVPNLVPSNCKKGFDEADQNRINNYNNLEPKNNIIIRTSNNETDHDHDHHQSSDGALSSLLSRENYHNSSSSDLMMDFNVEDLCKIFDSDYCIDVNQDQTTNNSVEVGDEGEGIIITNVMCCKTEEDHQLPSNFPEKVLVKENWRSTSGSDDHQGIQENNNHQSNMDSEFLTLASSFLECPDEEWPGYDLNISTRAA